MKGATVATGLQPLATGYSSWKHVVFINTVTEYVPLISNSTPCRFIIFMISLCDFKVTNVATNNGEYYLLPETRLKVQLLWIRGLFCCAVFLSVQMLCSPVSSGQRKIRTRESSGRWKERQWHLCTLITNLPVSDDNLYSIPLQSSRWKDLVAFCSHFLFIIASDFLFFFVP